MSEETKNPTVMVTVNISTSQLHRLLRVSELIGVESFDKTIRDVIDIAMEQYYKLSDVRLSALQEARREEE